LRKEAVNRYVIPRIHDQAIIKQTSSKHRAITAYVVHVYFECMFLPDVCSMIA